MARSIQKVQAGSRIFFRIEIRDLSDDTRPLYSPSPVPDIELRMPNGVVDVNWQAMTAPASTTGIFTYTHQTETTDPRGVWRVRFRSVDGSDIDYSIPQDAFELV